MFTKHNADGCREVLPGIRIKTLCYGDRTLMTEFQMDAGSALPMHGHAHEQTGYLDRGHVVLTIGGESHDVRPGDSWCIGADVEHGAQILENSTAIEVFSPVREDYLPSGRP